MNINQYLHPYKEIIESIKRKDAVGYRKMLVANGFQDSRFDLNAEEPTYIKSVYEFARTLETGIALGLPEAEWFECIMPEHHSRSRYTETATINAVGREDAVDGKGRRVTPRILYSCATCCKLPTWKTKGLDYLSVLRKVTGWDLTRVERFIQEAFNVVFYTQYMYEARTEIDNVDAMLDEEYFQDANPVIIKEFIARKSRDIFRVAMDIAKRNIRDKAMTNDGRLIFQMSYAEAFEEARKRNLLGSSKDRVEDKMVRFLDVHILDAVPFEDLTKEAQAQVEEYRIEHEHEHHATIYAIPMYDAERCQMIVDEITYRKVNKITLAGQGRTQHLLALGEDSAGKSHPQSRGRGIDQIHSTTMNYIEKAKEVIINELQVKLYITKVELFAHMPHTSKKIREARFSEVFTHIAKELDLICCRANRETRQTYNVSPDVPVNTDLIVYR